MMLDKHLHCHLAYRSKAPLSSRKEKNFYLSRKHREYGAYTNNLVLPLCPVWTKTNTQSASDNSNVLAPNLRTSKI